MSRSGRLRTALMVLLVLVALVPGHLCALCQGCTPAEAKAPCHAAAPPPPCHGGQQPLHEMTAKSCCDHLAQSPAESARQGIVVHGADLGAPAAITSGPGADPGRVAPEAFRAHDPPPLHTGVSLHTLHSVFLI